MSGLPSGASSPSAYRPAAEIPTRKAPVCTKDCTADCGRCKGDPLGDLRRRIIRSMWFSRDAHDGVPFDRKDTWRQGHDEARRAVMQEIGR